MKNKMINIPWCALALLLSSCIFGVFLPFLNIDLGVIILTPFRSSLIIVSVYSFILWLKKFKTEGFINTLKNNIGQLLIFSFFVVWFLIGAFWLVFGQTNTYAPTEVIGILSICMLAFCIFTLVRDMKDVRFLLQLCLLSGIILSVIANFEAIFGSFVPDTKNYYTIYQKIALNQFFFAPTTVFHNQNDFAAFISFCIAIVCFWMLRAKNLKSFLLYLGLAVFMVFPVSLADSNTFYLVLIGVISLMTIMLLLLKKHSLKTRLLQILSIFLVTILLAAFGFKVYKDLAFELNTQYHKAQINNLSDEDLDNVALPDLDSDEFLPPLSDTLLDQLEASKNNYGTIHIRMWLIRAGWDFFLDSPIFGGGPESFRENMSQNVEYLLQTRRIVNPHFFYIELLSQYGIILFAAYMAIALFILIRSLTQTFRELRNGSVGWGVIGLLLIGLFLVVAIMPSAMIRFTTLWIFFIAAATTVIIGSKKEKGSTSIENSL